MWRPHLCPGDRSFMSPREQEQPRMWAFSRETSWSEFFLMSWKPCHMSFNAYSFDGFYILWCHSAISWEQHNGLRSNKKNSSSCLKCESSLPLKPLIKAWIERATYTIYFFWGWGVLQFRKKTQEYINTQYVIWLHFLSLKFLCVLLEWTTGL